MMLKEFDFITQTLLSKETLDQVNKLIPKLRWPKIKEGFVCNTQFQRWEENNFVCGLDFKRQFQQGEVFKDLTGKDSFMRQVLINYEKTISQVEFCHVVYDNKLYYSISVTNGKFNFDPFMPQEIALTQAYQI